MKEHTADDRMAMLRQEVDPDRREALMTELLTVDAPPVVHSALRTRRDTIAADDREDLCAQVMVRLLRRLSAVGPADTAIRQFYDYVATVAYHVVDDYVRARNPDGALAVNRIRHLLRHDPQFALWDGASEAVCGLAEWRARPPAHGTLDPLGPHGVDANALLRFFRSAGGPVPLRTLISHVTRRSPPAPLADVAVPVDDGAFGRIESRQLLHRLWEEIVLLPPQQRIALLLNIRDSRSTSVLAVFPAAGIASVDEIAAILGLDAEALAARWSELPFDDNKIAGMLGLTRQQVINLRKSARSRLTRRMERR